MLSKHFVDREMSYQLPLTISELVCVCKHHLMKNIKILFSSLIPMCKGQLPIFILGSNILYCLLMTHPWLPSIYLLRRKVRFSLLSKYFINGYGL